MRTSLLVLLLVGCVRVNDDFTPLANAARAGDVATVRTLIARGADPNQIAGQNSWPPLLHAIHTDQIRSVEALLDGGADINRASPNGTTPLMMAAGYGYTDIVELLLKHGANPRIPGPDGVRALELAVTGVPDIDRFTVFQCHEDTIAALRAADPSMSIGKRAIAWAKIKRCRL